MNKKHTILIVDDEDINIDFILKTLNNDKYQFKVAQNGLIALKILNKFPIDLVLLDIQMPQMDGYELAQKIQEDAQLKNIPYIFLTAANSEESIVKGFELGAKDYITKPFNKHELQMRVDTHLTTYLQRQKILEQQNMLLQQSKLAAMGEMIAMIAHQWRQPLNVVSVLVQEISLKRSLDVLDDDEFDNLSQKIYKTLDYMSSTINDFRDYYKPSRVKSNFNIYEAINQAFLILQSRLESKEIEYKINCELNEIDYYGLEGEFKQVIINLLNNAIDVLEKLEKGIKRKIDVSITIQESSVKIDFEDNAGGIDEDIIEKVFEPYFSTKNEKNGTGLGLYMSKIIIEKNFGGEINVSNSSNGALFTIELKQ